MTDLKEAKWEDLDPFRMDQEAIDETLEKAPGCVVTWVAKNGRAMGVWVSHAVIDGQVWITTTGNRSKTQAWKRDPRVTAVFHAEDIGSVTLVGSVEMSDDAKHRTRFLNALYDRGTRGEEDRPLYMKHMDTEGRATGPIIAEKYISFDERKLVW
jgi:hypothetical protein